ncbi:TetR/AcrR family transcriptional regulator [Salininema proteolyticum]|uniref:TetR/AcrR family transcriptional regulator n=1 Tax=Salininema proteolyticum TaxID=1607685 RepID=A0ABV8TYG9_9ACTN
MARTRSEQVADAAIELLVNSGMRGLTHRAVDERAGLPTGSTSNIARSREALLELVLDRLYELQEAHSHAGEIRPLPREALVEFIAGALEYQYTAHREQTLARFEMALESNRRPELRAVYDRMGGDIRNLAIRLMEASGSREPVRHGLMIIAHIEGVTFEAVAGAGGAPEPERLRKDLADLLSGMLDPKP